MPLSLTPSPPTHRSVVMQPGAVPAFKAGAFVGVCVQGNPAPLAVGTAAVGSEQALARQAGKLLEVKQVCFALEKIIKKLAARGIKALSD